MMENKKILYVVTQAEWGGAQHYIFDLASNLANKHEIVVASGPEGSDENGLLNRLINAKVKTIQLKYLRRTINPWFDLLAFFELHNLFKKENPNVIHLNSTKVSILGSLVIKVFRVSRRLNQRQSAVKIIYTVHGWVFNEPMIFLKKWFYLWLEKFTAKFKDKIICVSEFDRQIALKYKICSPEKIITIHNSIDINSLNFLPKEQAKTELFNRSGRTLIMTQDNAEDVGVSQRSNQRQSAIVGTIANFYPTKGLKYFIEAINLLITHPKSPVGTSGPIRDYSLPVTSIIIGGGELSSKFPARGGSAFGGKVQSSPPEAGPPLAEKLKIDDKIILAGPKKNAYQYLSAFEIYVCSSVKEGFPYSILEAMAAGLPIVSTNVGGIPEMIENNFSGILVEPRNPEILAEKIKFLIENKNQAAWLGQNAKEKVREKFNLEKMIEETKMVYLN